MESDDRSPRGSTGAVFGGAVRGVLGAALLALERHRSVLRRGVVAGEVMGVDGKRVRRLAVVVQRLLYCRERLARDVQLDLDLGALHDRADGRGLELVGRRLAVGR